MPDPKKHHFLPQFYLERFADSRVESKLPHIHVTTKEARPRQYTAAIHDTACITDYHTIDFKDVPPDRERIETNLSKVEGRHKLLTDRVISTGVVDDTSKGDLALFVSLSHMRVPKFKRNIESMLSASVYSLGDAEMRASRLPPLPEALKQYQGKSLREFLRVEIYNWIMLAYMYDAAISSGFARILQGMEFRLVQAPPGRPFVTCDSPVSIFHPHYEKIRPYGVSPAFPEAEVTLPLTPGLSLLLTNEQRAESALLTEAEVHEFNRRCVVMADRYVYSSETADWLPKLVAKNHKRTAGFLLDEVGPYIINRFIPVQP
jgi:hypothetical protein